MAEAIERVTIANGKSYPGYLKTVLDDVDFLRGVLLEWAQYPENEAEAILFSLSEKGELTDKHLRTEGFLIQDNFSWITINLIKVGEGEWVVSGMSFEDLEEFAESTYGNIELAVEIKKYNLEAVESMEQFDKRFKKIMVGLIVILLLLLGGIAVFLSTFL